jgi:hypothetical protein
MTPHPFDPLSAVLGVLAVAAGVAVMVGGAATFEAGGGWWLAITALVVGVVLVPWRGQRVVPVTPAATATSVATATVEAQPAAPPVDDAPTE